MQNAPIPENEKERLEDLIKLNVLNTPREERFDYITRLASLVFNVPIATVALVDKEEIWFKSIQGINIETMNRNASFCGHAVVEKEHLVVPDATQDERFAENPMVINPPHVRFYAGVPLFSPKGRAVGTFCIIDSNPRELDDNQRNILKGFARWAETEINAYNISETLNYVIQLEEERLSDKKKLEEQREYLQSTLTSIGDGVITTNDKGEVIELNTVAENLTGWSNEEARGVEIESVFNIISGTEGGVVRNPVREALEKRTKVSLTGDVILVSRNGRRSQVADSCAPIYSREGEIKGVVLVFRDVTEEQKHRQQLEESEKKLKEAHIIAKMGRWDYYHKEDKIVCSDNIFRIFEINREDAWSRESFLNLTHYDDKEELERERESAVSERRGYAKDYRVITRSGKVKWINEKSEISYDTDGTPLHTVSILQDITDKKETEKVIRSNERQLEAFFSHSLYGFFISKLEHPVEWGDCTDKDSTLEYVIKNQQVQRVNQSLLDQHGLRREDIIGFSLDSLFNYDTENIRLTWRNLMDKGRWQAPVREIKTNGETIFIEGSYVCIYNEENKITGFFGAHSDVTEEKYKEKEEAVNLNLQKAVVKASSRMMFSRDSRELDDTFNNTLREIGVLFNSDRGYIFLFNDNLSLITNTHEWCREGVESQKDKIVDFPIENIPWFREQIIKREPIIIEDVDNLGEEASREKEEFKRQQIKSLICFPMHSSNGELIGFLGLDFVREKASFAYSQNTVMQVMANDMAEAIEKNRILKALEESEEKFRQITENIEDVVWLRSADNAEILYINPAYEKLWGRKKEYIYNNSDDFIESVIEEDKGAFYSEFANYKEKGVFSLEYRINRPDGLQKWVHARSYPIYSKEGEILRHVGIATDITPRKESMLQIKKSEEKYKNLVERVRQDYFFYSYNIDGDITYLSPSVKDVTGYQAEELENIYRMPFTENPVNEKLRACIERVCAGEEISSYEIEIFNKNKRVITLKLLDNPVSDVFGNIIGVEGLAKNITKEKQIEKTRMEFVSLVSHQLKTPLGSMAWDMEMLLSGDYGEMGREQKKVLGETHSMNRRMIELVNGLLNVSRLEMGKVAIELEETSIIDACEEAIREIRAKIISNKQEVVRWYDADTPNISADKRLLRIIWENIISNAVKYGYNGSKIEVGTRVEDEQIICYVKNKGKGIPDKEKESIFKRMFRASNAEELDPTGSGLGLYLVKSIIDTTDGDIWFESIENGETTFFFSFPKRGMVKKDNLSL